MNQPLPIGESFCAQYPVGSLFTGRVQSAHPFGVFLSVASPDMRALLELGEVTDEPVFPIQLPAVGDTLTAVIIQCNNKRRELILSIRPSQLRQVAG
jgi:ribosomal protein S1